MKSKNNIIQLNLESVFDKHIKENKTLDWCELSYKIMQLEDECFNLSDLLNENELNVYLQIIDDCEAEKAVRLSVKFSYSRYLSEQNARSMFSEEDEEL